MATYRTNMVSTRDKKLIVGMNQDFYTSLVNFNQWDDASKDLWQWTGAAEEFNIQTKDVDFGNPSRRKKIYKVYVTFKAGGYMSGVIAKYATNGSNTFSGTFNSTTYYHTSKGFDSFNGSQANSSADWITVALKPTSTLSTNNIYSFQLKFEFADAGRFGYTLASAAGTSGNTVFLLDTGASTTDDNFNGMPVNIFGGLGAGLTRRIYDYVGSTRTCTLDDVEDGNLTDADTIGGEGTDTTSYFDVGFIPKQFEINDISIIYREKPIK
jgi:hypothetical protein